MEINIGPKAIDGKIEVAVKYRDDMDGFGQTATLTVWVEDTDSRTTIDSRARSAARAFLAHCLAAHEPDQP